MSDRWPALWLCGPSGVGKSSVGWELFSQVTATGMIAAYVDLDQISFRRPAPDDDRENIRVRVRNLATIWPNYRAAGARCLVLSGIVNDPADVQRHVDALPDADLIVCRLRVSPEGLRERIRRRGRGGGPPLPGDELPGQSDDGLAAAAEDSVREAAEMERDQIGDLVVDTDGLTIAQVAAQVLDAAGGWPARRS